MRLLPLLQWLLELLRRLLAVVLIAALPALGQDGGTASDVDPAQPPVTTVPSVVNTWRGRLTLPDRIVLDVVGGCWLSEPTCIQTARLEEQWKGENARLRQNVLDAYKDKWALIAVVSAVVAALAFGAGYLAARAAHP